AGARARAVKAVGLPSGRPGPGAPGTLLSVGPDGLEVACGEGSLRLTSVQPEGKRVMTAREFLAGRPLAVGSTPFLRPTPPAA
ncbi:MAG: hypothetical protein INH41_23965, partial [Myxococcaceae bacterium]|nr:hypothetical protein [Myxococcaceae bacterium]